MPSSLYARKQRWWAMFVLSLPLFVVFLGCCTPQEEQSTPSPLPPTPSTVPLSSCASRGEHLAWEKLADQTIGKSRYDYEDEARIVVIQDADDAQALDGQIYLEMLRQVQAVDFSTFLVVAVFQGEQGSTGYAVEVTDVRQEDDAILICALFHEPAPGQITNPLVTSPYYILKVRKSPELKGNFTFTLVVNGQDVTHQVQAIP